MRKAVLVAAMVFCVASARGDVVTLPAAASLVGGAPFFSDVRAFNTSYASALTVTATYRCFIATMACPAAAPQIQFTLAPRESKAFNDICASAFGSPNTAGGVEFEFSGSEDQLVVTSRLFSTSPANSVGMFIPGLDESKTGATTVLTSIQHSPASTPPNGFRSNVGVFNPGSGNVTVSFAIFLDGVQSGRVVSRTVGAHSGTQISGIFETADLGAVTTDNAVIVVTSSGPVFSYAAVLDNRTTDPIFVVGAPNQAGSVTPSDTNTPSAPGSTATKTPTLSGPVPTKTRTPTVGGPSPTRTSTRTPTVPGPTGTPTVPGPTQTPTMTRTPTVPGPTFTRTPTVPTPTPIVPTPTPTPSFCASPCMVTIENFRFAPSSVTVHVGDVVKWTWSTGIYSHSTTSGSCPGGACTPDGHWDSMTLPNGSTYSHTFTAGDTGTRPYYCRVHLSGMTGTVIVVNP